MSIIAQPSNRFLSYQQVGKHIVSWFLATVIGEAEFSFQVTEWRNFKCIRYKVSNRRMIVNDEVGRIWNEAVLDIIKALTLWNRFLHENLIVSQLGKKCPAFFWARSLNIPSIEPAFNVMTKQFYEGSQRISLNIQSAPGREHHISQLFRYETLP